MALLTYHRDQVYEYQILNIRYPNLIDGTGTYDISITTWRPFGDRVTRLKSFFIGGSTELEDIEFINDLHLSDVSIFEIISLC
jgi:hypothetical protein